ncbi:acetyl-CoA carboxylase biotin carboxylase subunit [Kineosporia babensis]|uniref:Biotin-dependent 3-methylcrotonyl-coenzyme A carboxylase alpha1 subunit n=1 Tax=Kineosporia babensis TaxID=499548 RepID=A0A9X1NCB5_9ACTN|nr:acetyl/propionyl/methylcrotonyl-CoA carboxylase subunit alpha [Kineosporia babensis]MCD5310656.1 acetyl/propionyl/methylcrotonyl-CoA carboxylase subunit alpha [Kineosporia babensis]
MFDTVLVANRGEIAVRVIRTLRRLNVRSVAVYSDADAQARHVREADEAFRLGPAPARDSYLSIERLVEACLTTGAQAVHPGYGFLSENPAFATALEVAGVVFIGPPAQAIQTMGDKITAKNTVTAHGVPVVPGIAEPGLSDEDLIAAATGIGYPVLVKPSAGGGGKGMRLVDRPEDLAAAVISARREAATSFGDDALFLERFVSSPRHIEVQVLADQHGNVVHLGERECSLQRRHQKVVEEAPSPLLDPQTRNRIGAAACDTARSVTYAGAGTVEFIVSADRPEEFFFMEMNTRLQVEHPVTELVTGLDLVEWQLRVASGEPLGFAQEEIRLDGHAVEARVYAEDPGREFLPTGGQVLALAEPRGERIDSGLRNGAVIGSDYDPMLAKVIAHGPDRASALSRLDRALGETSVLGVVTNLAFLRHLLAVPEVRKGRLDTGLLDQVASGYQQPAVPDLAYLAVAAAQWRARWEAATDLWSRPDGWRLGDHAASCFRYAEAVKVSLSGNLSDASAEIRASRYHLVVDEDALIVDGRRLAFVVAGDDPFWVHIDGADHLVRPARAERTTAEDAASAVVRSPMPGTVVAVLAEEGQPVRQGTPLLAVEAMKMEHVLAAPVDGVVELQVKPGDQVELDQLLARLQEGDR